MTGTLVVGGGELSAHAREIFGSLVAAAGGPGRRFVVVAAASASPRAAFEKAAANLRANGVVPDSIRLAAMSRNVPGWEGGASDRETARMVEAADGIWITGGNQNILMEDLLRSDGSDTPVAAAIRRAHARGAAVGGSSAGAAVMSDPMIGGGTGFGALCPQPRAASSPEVLSTTGLLAPESTEALVLGRGLGLFAPGIVDQHFDTRDRLVRLVVACMDARPGHGRGFGIPEDTAIVLDGNAGVVRTLGANGVVVVDAGACVRDGPGGRPRIRGIGIHLLGPGDSLPIDGRERFPAGQGSGSADIHLNDASGDPDATPETALLFPEVPGLLSGRGGFPGFLDTFLLRNREDYLFRDRETGLGYVRSWLSGWRASPAVERLVWELRFSIVPGHTQARTGESGRGFRSVRLDILPVRMTIEEIR